jgi:hypothetical protein
VVGAPSLKRMTVSTLTQLFYALNHPTIFIMRYIVVVLIASMTSCASLTPEQLNAMGDSMQETSRQLAGKPQGGSGANSIERCRYWKDLNGNVFKQCD